MSFTEEWEYTEEKPRSGEVITDKRRIYLHFYYNDQKATDWIFRCGEAANPEKWKPSVRQQGTATFVNEAEPPVRCGVSH